ncbi:hypothetical protein [Nocardia sp. NPDC060259]
MKGIPWEETNRRARELDPTWDSPERVASREQMRAEQLGMQTDPLTIERP